MIIYPKDWKRSTVRDVFDFENGKGHEQNVVQYGRYIIVNSKFVSTEGEVKKYSNMQISPLEKNDIAMVMSDLPNGRALAKCYLVKENDKYTLNQRICRLRSNHNPVFMMNQLNRNRFYLAFDDGVQQTNLKRNDILDCPIFLPELNEQNAIAEAIESFDTHIANLNELIEKKKNIRDGALEDLMCGRIRLTNSEDKWEEKALSEICKVYDGTHQTPKYTLSGIRFVSVENISDLYSSSKYISLADYERDFKIRPELGDILMTRIGDIGTANIIDSDEPIAFYVSLALFKNIKVNSSFLKYYIACSDFQKELDDRTLHHATPKKINKGEIGKCIVKHPTDVKEQEAIASVLTAMDEEILNLEAEREKMIAIRDGAMDDLLTGRVRLK